LNKGNKKVGKKKKCKLKDRPLFIVKFYSVVNMMENDFLQNSILKKRRLKKKNIIKRG